MKMRTMKFTKFNEIKNKWAIGCTKYTASKVNELGQLKRSTSQYEGIRLNTDVISFKPPQK